MNREPVRYNNLRQVAELLGQKLVKVRQRNAQGLLPDPDVAVGAEPDTPNLRRVYGWSTDRVLAFGQLCGVLDDDGQPVPVPWNTPPSSDRRAAWWRRRTQIYLSTTNIALLWGRAHNSVQVRNARGSMAPADIRIGQPGQAGSPGWSWDTVERYSRQQGIAMAPSWEIARYAREHRMSIEEATRHHATNTGNV